MRPLTLFTGQWTDLPLAELAPLAKRMGYDGLELACGGDHFNVQRALKEAGYAAGQRALLAEHGLQVYAIGNHLIGQAVCDLIDSRHQAILPAHVWGDGEPEGVRQRAAAELADTARAARLLGVQRVTGFTGSSIWHAAYAFPPTSQAYWDAVGQKYTGCDFYQSALTFNKKDTLAVLSKYGIPSAKSVYLRKGENINVDEIVENLGLPVFVKPNQSGSSLGISKVKDQSELIAATEIAFKEDDEILIESFLDGMEVSVGVIDFKGETIVLGITEIVPQNEFFDYEAKYEGASEEITPARIDAETTKRVEEIAKRAYDSLGMSGFSRSEFILMDGVPYMLEMNTNPGFSPASILPQQAKIYGISIKDLCGNEVEKALQKRN
ncbi:MAG: ATP-grasp domain-containing protein [Pedobacter sp.]|nr:MAG: ATP-grasp domain-containing protein [Pedobacter sp.]